jgi:hypothetical protein
MTTAVDHTWDLFLESALADDDRGYPDSVSFVSADSDDLEVVVWRNLRRETPTVIVDEDAMEVMFVPVHKTGPVGWMQRARGRVHVCVVWRKHGASHEIRMPVEMNRRSLRNLELAPACAPA